MGNIILDILDSFSDEKKHTIGSKIEVLSIIIISSVYVNFIYITMYGDINLSNIGDIDNIYSFLTNGRVLYVIVMYALSIFFTIKFNYLLLMINRFIKLTLNKLKIKITAEDLIKRILSKKNKPLDLNLEYNIFKAIYLDSEKEIERIIYASSLIIQFILVILFSIPSENKIPFSTFIFTICVLITFLFQYFIYILNKILKKEGYLILFKLEKIINRIKDDKSTEQLYLESDKAITLRKQSIFPERVKFSTLLHKQIIEYNGEDSLVIGLNGNWGEGKTSAVNMALEPILENENTKHHILFFNPWNFSNSLELITSFLFELKVFIRSIRGDIKSNSIEDLIITYINNVTNHEVEDSNNPYFVDESTYRIKNEIEKEINTFDIKIIVVIDDIDRLDKEETKEIFKLVKAIANFNNTIYIIPYDKERIINQLEISDEYLKKIIQQEIELPPLDNNHLHELLQNKVSELLFNLDILNYWDKDRWSNVRIAGITKYIRNLRDVYKLINTLKFRISDKSYHELDMVDFLSITIIQLFDYNTYKYISRNKKLFTSPEKSYENLFEEKFTKEIEFINSQKDNNNTNDKISILKELFPLCTNNGNREYKHVNFSNQWSKDHRICSNEYFDKYFLHKSKEDDLLRSEIDKIISSTIIRDQFYENLKRIQKDDTLHFFLEKFKGFYEDKRVLENSINIISCFLELGKEDLNSNTLVKRNLSIEGVILYHIEKIGIRIDLFNSQDLLNSIISNKNHDINLTVEFYIKLCNEHGIKRKDTSNIDLIYLNPILRETHKSLLNRLRDSFNEISESKEFPSIIQYWRSIDKEFDIDFLLNKYLESNTNFISFLQLLKTLQYVNGSRGYKQREIYDIIVIKEIVNYDFFINKINEVENLFLLNSNTEYEEFREQFTTNKTILDKCISGEIDVNDRNWHKEF